jgi:hypothetical protein
MGFAKQGRFTVSAMLVVALVAPVAGQASAAADQVLAKAVAAVGGAAVVDGVKTMVVRSRDSRATPAGTADVLTTSYFRYPVMFRQEIEINGGKIAMVSTPNGAFLMGPGQFVELSAAERQNVEVTALRNIVTLLKSRRNQYFALEGVTAASIDGRDVDLLEIAIREERTKIAVDRQNGRIVQQVYQTGDPADPVRDTIVVSYSEFREMTPGLTLPSRARGTREGKVVFDSAIESVAVNVEIAPGLFSPAPTGPSVVNQPRSALQ